MTICVSKNIKYYLVFLFLSIITIDAYCQTSNIIEIPFSNIPINDIGSHSGSNLGADKSILVFSYDSGYLAGGHEDFIIYQNGVLMGILFDHRNISPTQHYIVYDGRNQSFIISNGINTYDIYLGQYDFQNRIFLQDLSSKKSITINSQNNRVHVEISTIENNAQKNINYLTLVNNIPLIEIQGGYFYTGSTHSITLRNVINTNNQIIGYWRFGDIILYFGENGEGFISMEDEKYFSYCRDRQNFIYTENEILLNDMKMEYFVDILGILVIKNFFGFNFDIYFYFPPFITINEKYYLVDYISQPLILSMFNNGLRNYVFQYYYNTRR